MYKLMLMSLLATALILCSCGRRADSSFALSESTKLGPEVYHVFQNRAEVETWVNDFRPAMMSLLGYVPSMDVFLPESDPRQERVERILLPLWNYYVRAYPLAIGKLPPPKIILVDDKAANAYAAYDPHLAMLPHVFFVHIGLLDFTDAAVEGVIAHELGHHVLKHGYPGQSALVRRIYKSDAKESFGRAAANDPVLAAEIKNWTTDAQIAGAFPLPEMNSVPMPSFGYPVLYNALQRLIGKYAPTEAICKVAQDRASDAVNALVPGIRIYDESVVLDKAQREGLALATRNLSEAATSCLSIASESLVDAIAMTLGTTTETIRHGFDPADIVISDQNKNVATAIFAMTAAKYSDMLRIESKNDFPRVRIYTIEEQADEEAVSALKSIGRDPTNASLLFRDLLKPSERAACLETIAANEVPGYGILSDEHHSHCYRIYHIEKYAASLEPSNF